MPRPAPAALRASGTAVLLVLVLSGCSASDSAAVARPEPSSTYTAEVPVLVPGAPGDAAEVVQPGETGVLPNPAAFGDVEVTFVTSMVPHHAQALEMAALAPERAADPRVEALAARIAADQAPEIETMNAWLRQNGLPEASATSDHGAHGDMPGMASDAEMTRLVAARGPAFDRLFLELMVRHHEGAIAMADDAAAASNVVVAEMVADTGAKQSVEIARMQELLADLPA